MGEAATINDPLSGGFYTAAQAARLLQIENPRRIHGWLAGYRNSGAGAVLNGDYEPIGRAQALSFWDLMEIRFLEHFRKQNVPLQTLRKVAINARKDMGVKHPFALSNLRYLTDRKAVFSHTAEEEGDKKTLNLVTNQFEMYEAIETALAKGVAFDPISGLAASWKPLEECPNIIILPEKSFGRPVMAKSGVPVSAIIRTWQAEEGNRDRVARWFEIDRSQVDDAIDFQVRLAA